MGMSFVVLILIVATFVPALDPMYGIPSSITLVRITSNKFLLYNVSSNRNVLPPPIKRHWAFLIASIGSAAEWIPSTSKPHFDSGASTVAVYLS